MLEIFGKNYYLDLDAINDTCEVISKQIKPESEDDDEDEVEYRDGLEINVFKYETIKMCIGRVLDEMEYEDEDDDLLGKTKSSKSFIIAFNTLINYNILKEND